MPLGEIKRSRSLGSIKDAGAVAMDKPMPGKLTSVAVAQAAPRYFDSLVRDCAPTFYSHPTVLETPLHWRLIKARAVRTNDPARLTKRLVDKYGFWKNAVRTNFESEPIFCRHMCMMDLAFRLIHAQQDNSNGAREAFFSNIENIVEYDEEIYKELNTLAGAINKQSEMFERVSPGTFNYWVQDKFKHMRPNCDGSLVEHFYIGIQAEPISHAMNIQLKIKYDKKSGKPIYHVSVFDPNNAGVSTKFRYEELYEVAGLVLGQFTSQGDDYLDGKDTFNYLIHPISTGVYSSNPDDTINIYRYDLNNVERATGPRNKTLDYEFDHDY